ncbi:MAG TPA: DUF882 domain-containing protein [Polyangia bacterium]
MLALVAYMAMSADLVAAPEPDPIFDPVAARGEHFVPGEPRVLAKKEEWLRDKELRPDVHVSDADLARWATPSRAAHAHRHTGPNATGADPELWPGERVEPVTTLYNVWTHEALPILPDEGHEIDGRFYLFLRDHFTNQATRMDARLVDVLKRVAGKFSARRIEVVSGYRSPKYNLMLRKKGHQVARHSQHMEGHAVDFRIRGVATRQVLHYVRSLHMGGVGFYPHSQFVHSDTGPVRYWTGS